MPSIARVALVLAVGRLPSSLAYRLPAKMGHSARPQDHSFECGRRAVLFSTALAMGGLRANAIEGDVTAPLAEPAEVSVSAAPQPQPVAEVSVPAAPEPQPAAEASAPPAAPAPQPAAEASAPPAAPAPLPAAIEPEPAASQSTVPQEIGYKELVKQLNVCQETGVCAVQRVEFLNSSGEQAVAYIGGTEYKVLDIPLDNPNNDSSPLKLAAKLRDANVPYTFPFSNYLKKARDAAPPPSSSQPSPSGFGLPSLSLPSLPSLPSLF